MRAKCRWDLSVSARWRMSHDWTVDAEKYDWSAVSEEELPTEGSLHTTGPPYTTWQTSLSSRRHLLRDPQTSSGTLNACFAFDRSVAVPSAVVGTCGIRLSHAHTVSGKT